MFKFAKAVSLATALLFSSATAYAGVTTVDSQATFSSLGTITQNTNFDSYTGGFDFPGDNFIVGALNFTGPQNLITGQGNYGFNRPTMTNNYWTPINALVNSDTEYDLFGFNMGVGGSYASLTIRIATTLGTYDFFIANPPTSSSMQFFGFAASQGEFLRGFRLDSSQSSGSLAGITDIQLGNAGPGNAVPEPASYFLFALGLIALAALRRKQG